MAKQHHIPTITVAIVLLFFYFNNMMLGPKVPNYDACRIVPCCALHNPAQYSHIVKYTSHFYAHIGAGFKVFYPLMSKLMWMKDLETLAA